MKTPLPADLRLDRVTLVVRDLDRVASFYTKQLGFALHSSTSSTAAIGSGEGEPFLVLEEGRDIPVRPAGSPGLFHVAYLYADRQKLAHALRLIAAGGVRFDGFSDHLVSEAIYLSDPEGNGIELYRDRREDEWPYRNGQLMMSTDPLDVDGLLEEAPVEDGHERKGLRIGHIHLQTSDLLTAESFWVNGIGFDVVTRAYPGALFVSAGGYHHHFGLNVWRSKGRTLPEGRWTGLSAIDISVPSRSDMGPIAERFGASGADTASVIFEGTNVTVSSY